MNYKAISLQLKQLENLIRLNEQQQIKSAIKKENSKMLELKDCHIRFHNGVYEIQYRRNGFNKSFSSKYKTKAITKAKEWLKSIATNKAKNDTKNAFYNFANEWFLNVKQQQVKAVTFCKLQYKFNNYVLTFLRNKNVKYITPMILQNYFNELQKDVPRTLEDVKSLFNQLFIYAIANRITDINPINAVYTKKHEREQGKAMLLQDEQIFIDKIKQTKFELAFLIILYTGCRPSEQQNIKFDFDKETITIQNAKLKSYQKIKQRILPMFPTIKNLKQRILNEQWQTSETTLAKTIWQLNLGFTVKDLRHTFATKCKECFNIPNEIVNLWQGHNLGKDLTANTYTHYSIEYQRQFAEKIVA